MKLQIHGSLYGGILYCSHCLIGHEVLLEGLLLEGLEPGEVRLVVGKYSGHELYIGAILISQVAVPGLSEVSAAPGPLLLSGRDMMVCHMEYAGLHAIVIAAHEVEAGLLSHI